MSETSPRSEQTLARRLWLAVEPVHAVIYFHAAGAQGMRDMGVSGWWNGYFAGRLAPCGQVGAATATAMVFGFAPSMVARAVPRVWTQCDVHAVAAVRAESGAVALGTTLPGQLRDRLLETLPLLEAATSALRLDGRALAAGWAATSSELSPLGRVWRAATILREHRGDGHVAAAVALGLTGLDATVSHVAAGAMPRALMQTNRGWSDAEWERSEARLRAAGTIDRTGRLTRSGGELRRQLETDTDRLSDRPRAGTEP